MEYKLTPEQIKKNWDTLLKLSGKFGDRSENILKMYSDMEDKMILAPASSFNYFHNAIHGGYVDHILRVMKFANSTYELWKESGADMSGYTKENLLFVAMFHDLGKMRLPEEKGYVPCESEWHRKNQGKMYETDAKENATIQDLSLYLLQHYKIDIQWVEYLSIRVHDGPFDETNKPYWLGFSYDKKYTTNLPYVIHQADMMAARVEFEMWRELEKK